MSERLRRWRMILGGQDADGTGTALSGVDARRDAALEALYGKESDRRGGLGASSPRVARWLGDIRGYFPSSVVQVMQRDAIDRLGLRELLLEPELLESVQPDVHLVGTLLSLNRAIPERSRETARAVVRKVVDELEKRLAQPTRQAVSGALHRAGRTNRPRHGDIDWNRTILANLRHYQPEQRTVVPERLVGFGRRLPSVSRRIVLCLDQSGSMAASVVYASVFGAVLASIRSLRTQIIAFDTAVADLTEAMPDPVELLFGVQLGGGTDINAALAYCQSRIDAPRETVLVLISDLFEGGDEAAMRQRAQALRADGVQVVCLLALSDDGAPAYDHDNAAALAALGIPAFACTPDQFPDLLAAAIQQQDLVSWTAANDIPTAAPAEGGQ
ncbi:VWA domain-containing protein [Amycolatopsis granulosa]|uniref:VWA domain-containing protein n=1 Tax=Amycolatopsis granulosa TaxID=185684 RepID=UPI00141F8501|nr:VWA domain-containing protein [Amycolatopsis granulosa]NIH83649.1 Mg-chelatase subunit ChlD [Amycolatopsis granulosa]